MSPESPAPREPGIQMTGALKPLIFTILFILFFVCFFYMGAGNQGDLKGFRSPLPKAIWLGAPLPGHCNGLRNKLINLLFVI